MPRNYHSVAVLLPDSKSSVRWETVDRPFLKAAFQKAGVEATIQNAEGDKSAQQQQAEQAITNGAKVILLVNLDSGSGAAIENGLVPITAFLPPNGAIEAGAFVNPMPSSPALASRST